MGTEFNPVLVLGTGEYGRILDHLVLSSPSVLGICISLRVMTYRCIGKIFYKVTMRYWKNNFGVADRWKRSKSILVNNFAWLLSHWKLDVTLIDEYIYPHINLPHPNKFLGTLQA